MLAQQSAVSRQEETPTHNVTRADSQSTRVRAKTQKQRGGERTSRLSCWTDSGVELPGRTSVFSWPVLLTTAQNSSGHKTFCGTGGFFGLKMVIVENASDYCGLQHIHTVPKSL